MRQPKVVGVVMILVAVLLGAALDFGLYQWEFATRASGASSSTTSTSLSGASSTVSGVAANTTIAGTNSSNSTTGPAQTAEIDAGAKVFASNCDACHPKANAGVGPALHGKAFAAQFPDDAAIRAIVRSGRDGMPAFPPANLSDADLNAVIAYLRSLK